MLQVLGGNISTNDPSAKTLTVSVPPLGTMHQCLFKIVLFILNLSDSYIPVPPFVYAPDVLDEGFRSESGAEVGRVTTKDRTVRVSPVSSINGDVEKYAIIVLLLPTGALLLCAYIYIYITLVLCESAIYICV